MNILFVDDERFMLNAVERNLRDSNWDIDVATSGPEALVKIQEQDFDVIVTDMAMPAMKGDRLLKEVRVLRPQMTRIILSGYADHSLDLEDPDLAHRWIDKPVEPDYLVKVLEEIEAERRAS